jgi:hypothetical protein
VIRDLDEVLKELLTIIRQSYPNATVKEIKIGKKKIRVYGADDRIWFKLILYPEKGLLRVYSNSRTIEFGLKNYWRKVRARNGGAEEGLQEKDYSSNRPSWKHYRRRGA